MFAVQASQIVKSFGHTRAVDGVSFALERDEILGLLGPNGAGKTTTIRIVLDIFRPDSGTVAVLGGPMTEDKKDRIGYMPEERGLYQDIALGRCLVYLATLKGLSPTEAQATILVIWPLVLSVVVAILNYETPHAPLVVALSLFPLCAPVMMMTRLVAGGVPWWQPPLAAGLMLVTAALVIRAAAGVFRAQVLLSGQPFTARRFLAALAGRA